MFRSAQNLRLAADMRALQRVAAPWRSARRTWFDGTPESIAARIAATDRVLSYARAGSTAAHLALEREAATARAELTAARDRLLTDFLDDGARVAGTSRNAPGGVNDRQRVRNLDDNARNSFNEWYHGQPSENFRGARGSDMLDMFHDHTRDHGDYDALFGDDAQRDALHDHLVSRFGSRRMAAVGILAADAHTAPVPVGGGASTTIPGAISKAIWNGAPMTGQEEDPGFNPGPKRTGLRVSAIEFLAAQNTRDRSELLFRAHRHASDRTGQLPVPTAQRTVQAFVAAVNREISRTAAEAPLDQACDACNAEAGEDCRPWCVGKAAHDDERGEKKQTKKSHRTAAVVADFDDHLLFGG